jgi:hypothetical protein
MVFTEIYVYVCIQELLNLVYASYLQVISLCVLHTNSESSYLLRCSSEVDESCKTTN